MKKVVLLGDSIRQIGYGARTAELLAPEYAVWQPEDNCRFASYTFRMLFEYQAQMKGADVFHFNCGLWDMCDLYGDGPFTPIDVYVDTLLRIVRVLKGYLAPGGKIIFALTTVPSKQMWGHSWQRVDDYNAAAMEALEKEGVLFDDICTPVKADPDTMLLPDMLHLTPKAVEQIAAQVAACIRNAAE